MCWVHGSGNALQSTFYVRQHQIEVYQYYQMVVVLLN
mgnify:CR=1 FL=1